MIEPEKHKAIHLLSQEGMSVREISRRLRVSRKAVRRIIRHGGEVYVRWVMTFTTERRSTTIVAPGISHLRFDADGRILYHRDYWDASGALAELVPLVGPVLRAVRARL